MFLSLSACTGKNNEKGKEEKKVEEKSDKLTITDIEGRKIELKKPVNKIIAIGSALRMYTYVNKTDKLVGVEKAQQNLKSGRPYIMSNPKLAELPVIGEGHPQNPDPELISSQSPDVIIAGNIMDRGQLEELQNKTGIPVVIVDTGSTAIFDPKMYKSLEIIGEITGKQDRAKKVVDFMEKSKKELQDKVKDVPENEKKTVYIGAVAHKGTHGIESTNIKSPMTETIMAKNVVDALGGEGHIKIDKEKLLEWNPDVLVIDAAGLKLVKEDVGKNPEFYKNLKAVKNDQVHLQIPYVSYYNNIETALADIYNLASILYPKQFKDMDPKVKADEIFEFMNGEKLYSKMEEKFGGFKKIKLF